MCDTPRPAGPAIVRPRWALLYGAAFSPLAALAVVEVAAPPNAVRTVLRFVFAIGAFAGMALWVRVSRTALDMLDWCACAGATVSMRVIESRRPSAAPELEAPELDTPILSPAWTEEERELAIR
jgi:hypothetical protein